MDPAAQEQQLAPRSSSRRAGTSVHVVERVFRLLEALARRPAGVSDLARTTGIHKATVHRLLSTLVGLGYAERAPGGDSYRAGLRLLELGGLVLSQLELRDVARPELAALRDRTRLTVHMGVLDGTEVVYVEKLDSPTTIRMASYVGGRNPVHCTAMGKALLAALPPAHLERVLEETRFERRTENTRVTVPDLLADLRVIRERGYALDDVENEEGIRCVAAAIHGYGGRVVAAVSVSGATSQLPLHLVPETGQSVAEAAARISRALGYAQTRELGGGTQHAPRRP